MDDERNNDARSDADDARSERVSPAGTPRTAPPAGRRLPGRLVALGSAAVMTIYGTGYFKTKEAAARFADDAMAGPGPRRTPALPADESAGAPAANATDAADASLSNAVADASPADSAVPPAQSLTVQETPELDTAPPTLFVPERLRAAIKAAADSAAMVASLPAELRSVVAAPKPEIGAAAFIAAPTVSEPDNPPEAIVEKPTVVAAKPAVIAAKSAPVTPPAPAPAPRPAAATSARDAGQQRKWNDGTYTGWGTSRHGDIQATVVIENDVIKSAVISQCLTRYSCSWVSMLPGQVVTRQSPEVDYVSGATQSTNAFYYAVVQALGVAKVK